MKRILILFSLLLVLSCGEKKDRSKIEDKPTDTSSSENIKETQEEPSGLTNLGMSLLDQDMVGNEDQGVDQAKIEQAKQAAQNGDVQAMMALSAFYYQSNEKNESKKWLKMAADKGNLDAVKNLAIIAQEEGNEKEARMWFEKLASKSNDGQLTLSIAGSYYKDNNFSEAKKWFEKAYNLGIKDVDVNIASINERQKNMSEAVKWYKRAVARGEKKANANIGIIYFDQNKNSEAREYLIKGYNSGIKGLAMPIAITYHKQNKIEDAKKWYKIAANNGDKDAKKNLELLNSALKSDDSSYANDLFNTNDITVGGLTGGNKPNIKQPEKTKTNESFLDSVNKPNKGQSERPKENDTKSDPNEMFNIDNQ